MLQIGSLIDTVPADASHPDTQQAVVCFADTIASYNQMMDSGIFTAYCQNDQPGAGVAPWLQLTDTSPARRFNIQPIIAMPVKRGVSTRCDETSVQAGHNCENENESQWPVCTANANGKCACSMKTQHHRRKSAGRVDFKK